MHGIRVVSLMHNLWFIFGKSLLCLYKLGKSTVCLVEKDINMLQMTDVMVDTETTGLNPQTSAIIQLSAIKFNFKERAIGQMFDRAPAMLPMRSWHEGTREFWMVKNRATYDELIIRQEEARPVFLDFFNWIGKDEPEGGYRFWA